jgi:uncharacterized protein YndB with AHSA1/START domain
VDAVTIERSVELDAPAGRVWAATRTPAAFRYVTRGVLRITGLPRTGRFGQGGRIEGWMLLGGVLPLHRHHLEVVRVDHTAMTLSSHEWGGVLRRWDHDIVIEGLDDDRRATPTGSSSMRVGSRCRWRCSLGCSTATASTAGATRPTGTPKVTALAYRVLARSVVTAGAVRDER